jgi:hypothetical protein
VDRLARVDLQQLAAKPAAGAAVDRDPLDLRPADPAPAGVSADHRDPVVVGGQPLRGDEVPCGPSGQARRHEDPDRQPDGVGPADQQPGGQQHGRPGQFEHREDGRHAPAFGRHRRRIGSEDRRY